MKRYNAVAVGCIIALYGIAGFGCSPSGSSPSGVRASVAPARIEEGKQFIAALQKLPPGERQAYAAKNQAVVQSLTTTGDPQLITQFTQLMRESPKR